METSLRLDSLFFQKKVLPPMIGNSNLRLITATIEPVKMILKLTPMVLVAT